jgi:hypothetical protein
VIQSKAGDWGQGTGGGIAKDREENKSKISEGRRSEEE